MSSTGKRKAKPRTAKGSRQLYVQPAELARKLVKEMEAHKVSRSGHISVRNRYTIYLCPEDYERLRRDEDVLTAKLERHLSKHAGGKGYGTASEIVVSMTVDEDLRPGYFGILAEREAPGLAEHDLPDRPWYEQPDREEPLASDSNGMVAVVGVGGVAPGRAENGTPKRAARATRAGTKRMQAAETEPTDGATKIIPAEDAEALGLARQTIVITAGNRVTEYHQGRVILGRSRDVDFVIDNPDVSRRHAVLYWSSGDIVLEDLGSTNGTMVNGYPISSTVIAPSDVVTIGDCRLTVGTR